LAVEKGIYLSQTSRRQGYGWPGHRGADMGILEKETNGEKNQGGHFSSLPWLVSVKIRFF
jgi:hypothetical protein